MHIKNRRADKMARPRPFPMFEQEILKTRTCVEIAGEGPFTPLCLECPNYKDDGGCKAVGAFHGEYFVRVGR